VKAIAATPTSAALATEPLSSITTLGVDGATIDMSTFWGKRKRITHLIKNVSKKRNALDEESVMMFTRM
jgi:hypothetical protein